MLPQPRPYPPRKPSVPVGEPPFVAPGGPTSGFHLCLCRVTFLGFIEAVEVSTSDPEGLPRISGCARGHVGRGTKQTDRESAEASHQTTGSKRQDGQAGNTRSQERHESGKRQPKDGKADLQVAYLIRALIRGA